jgi:GcrA cell cycle regulator
MQQQSKRDEVVDFVLGQWSKGNSAKRVAEHGNQTYGDALPRPLTRSSVCGIVHRASKRGDPRVAHTGRTTTRSVRKVKKPKAPPKPTPPVTIPLRQVAPPPTTPRYVEPAEGADAPPPRMLSVLQLERDTCRWPIGDPRAPDFGFCGHPSEGRYCPHHEHAARRKKGDEDADAGQEIAA